MMPRPASHFEFRRGAHYLWWAYCSVVAIGAIVFGRPVIIGGSDRNPELLALAILCAYLLALAIARKGRWVLAFIVATGFDYCIRVGALIVDESKYPLPPRSRALAALLYGGFAFSLALTYGTWKTLEGENGE